MKLLRKYCSILSPSGSETYIYNHIIKYVQKLQDDTQDSFQIFSGKNWYNQLIVSKGVPEYALVVHVDTVGFIVLFPIGSPQFKHATSITNIRTNQKAKIVYDPQTNYLVLDSPKTIPKGSFYGFTPFFNITEDHVVSPYLDNRIGLYLALTLLKELDNLCIICTNKEEIGSPFIIPTIDKIKTHLGIQKYIIVDALWENDECKVGAGTILLKHPFLEYNTTFTNKLIHQFRQHNISYQLYHRHQLIGEYNKMKQVNDLKFVLFLGYPIKQLHSNKEIVSKQDITTLKHSLTLLMR